MLTKDDFIIRSFNLTSRDIGGRACSGMSVLVRDGIPYSECKLYTTLQAKAVTISMSKTITVCSLYLPPSENLNIVLLTVVVVYPLPWPLLVGGVRCSRLWSTSQLLWPAVQSLRRGLSTNPGATMWCVCGCS